MKISHELEDLNDTQKSNLETAQIIVDNMNRLVERKTSFSYNGNSFSPVQFGDESAFLNRLLNFVSKNKLDNSIEYIIEETDKSIASFNNTPNSQESVNSYRKKISSFLKNYPTRPLSLDSAEELIKFIKKLDS